MVVISVPRALRRGKTKGKMADLQTRRVRYDHASLAMAVLPLLLLLWPSVIGAPIALYMSLRYRKEPCGLLNKSTLCFKLAAILACAQIAGWVMFFCYIAMR